MVSSPARSGLAHFVQTTFENNAYNLLVNLQPILYETQRIIRPYAQIIDNAED